MVTWLLLLLFVYHFFHGFVDLQGLLVTYGCYPHKILWFLIKSHPKSITDFSYHGHLQRTDRTLIRLVISCNSVPSNRNYTSSIKRVSQRVTNRINYHFRVKRLPVWAASIMFWVNTTHYRWCAELKSKQFLCHWNMIDFIMKECLLKKNSIWEWHTYYI